MDCSTPRSSVLHHLLEFAQTHVHWVGDAICPSHPLLSPSSFAFNLQYDWYPYKWEKFGHRQREKVMGSWRQRSESCSCKARNAKDCQQTIQSQVRHLEQILSHSSQEKPTLLTFWPWNFEDGGNKLWAEGGGQPLVTEFSPGVSRKQYSPPCSIILA